MSSKVYLVPVKYDFFLTILDKFVEKSADMCYTP